MKKYATPGGDENEFEQGSRGRVLKNRLKITTVREISRVEHEGLEATYIRRLGANNQRVFSASGLCALHREAFGKIYSWAGEYRSVNISKAEITFCLAPYISQAMAAWEQRLIEYFPIKRQSKTSIISLLAESHAEILLIHPFREGNGRITRLFAQLLAVEAGMMPPEFGLIGKGSQAMKQKYFEALRTGYFDRDYRLLEAFFAEALERGAAEAAEDLRVARDLSEP